MVHIKCSINNLPLSFYKEWHTFNTLQTLVNAHFDTNIFRFFQPTSFSVHFCLSLGHVTPLFPAFPLGVAAELRPPGQNFLIYKIRSVCIVILVNLVTLGGHCNSWLAGNQFIHHHRR